MNEPVLAGATMTITVTHPVTDEQVLGALGKKITDKLTSLVVCTPHPDGLVTSRYVLGQPGRHS